ncbi:MAG TPA: response regulator [Roseiflexaceae bacterium]|nr:response regulator [Roseiflexaceae bacterium]
MSSRRHILIVDGDPSAALVTQRGLQLLLGESAQVDIAPTPGAAWLRCIRDGADLVIVDPSPQSRGAAALVKALHDERPSIPVLVLTAYDTPRLRAQMRALGVRHYLAKPIDLLELQQTVNGALGVRTPAE